MKENLKIIDFFKILSFILITTVIITIIASKKIEKTNQQNQSIKDQKNIIESYISDNQNAENTKELLKKMKDYIRQKQEYPNMIPTIEFYGKDNANTIIIYTTIDKEQEDYYINSIDDIINSINSTDTFYITIEDNESDEYIEKIVIEYN